MKRPILMALIAGAEAAPSARCDESVRFNTRDPGKKHAIVNWGIDATWASPESAKESVRNGGPEIDFVRIGFYLNEKLEDDGNLSAGNS